MAVIPVTSSRQFRKGRVLHASGSLDVLLVDSPEPRKWDAISVDSISGVHQFHRRLTSASLKYSYKHYSLGLRRPFGSADAKVIAASAESYFGRALPYQARRALVTRTIIPAGGVVAPSLTATSLTPPPMVTPDPTVKAPTPARKRSTTFDVPALPTSPYWYESESDTRLYRDFISMRQAGHTVNLMVAGPSGSGKTRGVQILGEELGLPVHIINCQAITTPEKWIGQMMADPEKGTYFEPSQHIQWVEATSPECAESENCIMLYDEITRLRPELNNMTYSLFDTQRGLEVPQLGRRAFMHKKNLIIATANIGAAFAGTFGQDRAFRERFSMTMERDFPPMDEERKILTTNTGVDAESADALVKVADASRRLWRAQDIEQPISTRSLEIWALLVAGGYTIMQAADYTVIPLYSEDGGESSDRTKVRAEIEGKAA